MNSHLKSNQLQFSGVSKEIQITQLKEKQKEVQEKANALNQELAEIARQLEQLDAKTTTPAMPSKTKGNVVKRFWRFLRGK